MTAWGPRFEEFTSNLIVLYGGMNAERRRCRMASRGLMPTRGAAWQLAGAHTPRFAGRGIETPPQVAPKAAVEPVEVE